MKANSNVFILKREREKNVDTFVSKEKGARRRSVRGEERKERMNVERWLP